MFRYRFLLSLFALAVLAGLVLRGRRAEIAARLGRIAPARPGPHVWLHAASNGELASARPAIDALLADPAGHRLLITCNSTTGLALARSWELPRTEAMLAPLDLRRATRSVMQRWRVQALILTESELWPNRVALCPGPVMLIGARLTEGTARAWSRLGRVVPQTLGHIALASAQDAASRDRLLALGLPATAIRPDVNLKALYRPTPLPDSPEARALAAAFPRQMTWLAASTHEGEEEIVLAAHAQAMQAVPGLRLILAPRHPRRGDAVQGLIAAAGLRCARRSQGQPPEPGAVYLADTLGEMALWYNLAGIAFVGGSVVDRGGHTPYEPAAHGQAILHGPHVGNFTQPYAALHDAGAALTVHDAAELAQALIALSDPAAQTRNGAQAQQVLAQGTAFDTMMSDCLAILSGRAKFVDARK